MKKVNLRRLRDVFILCLLLCATGAMAQERQIKGQVVDPQGAPLPGVSIAIKGGAVQTATDSAGKFASRLSAGQHSLVFSSVGMQTTEVKVNTGQTFLAVSLDKASRDLNEVVVVGYGTAKKVDRTGSVGSIKGSDLIKTPAVSVDQLLQGKVPGLQVITSSGQPGAGATIRIRGLGSRADA